MALSPVLSHCFIHFVFDRPFIASNMFSILSLCTSFCSHCDWINYIDVTINVTTRNAPQLDTPISDVTQWKLSPPTFIIRQWKSRSIIAILRGSSYSISIIISIFVWIFLTSSVIWIPFVRIVKIRVIVIIVWQDGLGSVTVLPGKSGWSLFVGCSLF